MWKLHPRPTFRLLGPSRWDTILDVQDLRGIAGRGHRRGCVDPHDVGALVKGGVAVGLGKVVALALGAEGEALELLRIHHHPEHPPGGEASAGIVGRQVVGDHNRVLVVDAAVLVDAAVAVGDALNAETELARPRLIRWLAPSSRLSVELVRVVSEEVLAVRSFF